MSAPPSSSKLTSSPVTVRTTSGPVMNMWAVRRVISTKSVIAGEYTAPPAHGPMHERDLRDHARRLHVAPEDLGVAAERDDALLDARAARVVDPDERAAEAQREVHHLADLLGEGLAERPAEDGEVLREHEDPAAVHETVAGDHAVTVGAPAQHVEVRVAVADERVELDERPGVEERLDALAGEPLAPLVLSRDRAFVARVARLVAEPLEARELARGRVRIGRGGRLADAHAAQG